MQRKQVSRLSRLDDVATRLARSRAKLAGVGGYALEPLRWLIVNDYADKMPDVWRDATQIGSWYESRMTDALDEFRARFLAGMPSAVDETIHENDEMYVFARDTLGADKARMVYLKLGSDLAHSIDQIADWRFGERKGEIKVLEFASGHGRNVRHLVRMFGPHRVSASDIYADAVAFNITQFGVNGKLSVHDPADFTWDQRFDLIVVPSLFSHLPEATFAPWIKALHALLTEEGILVFSTHGEHLQPYVTMPDDGIMFTAQSESVTLDHAEYGTSHVTEAFVARQIARATGHSSYSYTRRGFWNHQDFYIVPRRPSDDLASFDYHHGVVAHLDRLVLNPDGALEIAGWAKAIDATHDEYLQIRVCVDGVVVAQGPSRLRRDEVAVFWGEQARHSGYWFLVPEFVSFHTRDSVLVLEALGHDGTTCIEAMPVGALLTGDQHREGMGVRVPLRVSKPAASDQFRHPGAIPTCPSATGHGSGRVDRLDARHGAASTSLLPASVSRSDA